MAGPTEAQIDTVLELGSAYLAGLPREIRRPNGTYQLPPKTGMVVSMDSPGIPITRIIPKNSGNVRAGSGTDSTTGVALAVLEMQGDYQADFDYITIGSSKHGLVTNIVESAPTLSGDTWTFTSTAHYKFINQTSGSIDSEWDVKYETTWSDSASFDPKYEVWIKYTVNIPADSGVLAWDNFAVVPAGITYQKVVSIQAEQPSYRMPSHFHTIRNHKSIHDAHLMLNNVTNNAFIREHLPGLNDFWRQFSAIPNQLATNSEDRVIRQDVYDGLWGWTKEPHKPFPELYGKPAWLMSDETFYEPELFSKLFPVDVGRTPYPSRVVSKRWRMVWMQNVWWQSPQMRCHIAMDYLWHFQDSFAADFYLGEVEWDGDGIDVIEFGGNFNKPRNVTGYKGFWLGVYLCAVSIMEAYLVSIGDPHGFLTTYQTKADEAATAVMKAQIPASGIYRDDTLGLLAQPDHTGGVMTSYKVHDASTFKSKPWLPIITGVDEQLFDELVPFARTIGEQPHHYTTPTSYEPTLWAMIGMAYYRRNRFGAG